MGNGEETPVEWQMQRLGRGKGGSVSAFGNDVVFYPTE
jgi:hypothetical protein